MKRTLLFLLVTAAVIGMSVAGPVLGLGKEDFTVKFTTGEEISSLEDCTCLASGGDTIVIAPSAIARSVYAKLREVKGVTLEMEGGGPEMYRYLNKLAVRIVRMEQVEGIYCVYGFSPYVKMPAQKLDGREVNVQFAVSGNALRIGFPMILTDY